MPGCIIQADAKIGANSIINAGSIIEHDCLIASDAIWPPSRIERGVSVGETPTLVLAQL